jgi:hypothetical protein
MAVLVAIVLAGTTEGWQGWEWDNWPIDARQMAEGAVGDALTVRELLDHFEMDWVDWCNVLWQADRLGRRQDFRRLVVRIAEELERVELLYADDLRKPSRRHAMTRPSQPTQSYASRPRRSASLSHRHAGIPTTPP